VRAREREGAFEHANCGDPVTAFSISEDYRVAPAWVYPSATRTTSMYRAGDAVDQAEWLAELDRVADRLDLEAAARSTARDLFLSTLPDERRSKRAALAAAVYAGSLVAGDQRSQTAVAAAADVSRLSVQGRWKGLLEEAGLTPPSW